MYMLRLFGHPLLSSYPRGDALIQMPLAPVLVDARTLQRRFSRVPGMTIVFLSASLLLSEEVQRGRCLIGKGWSIRVKCGPSAHNTSFRYIIMVLLLWSLYKGYCDLLYHILNFYISSHYYGLYLMIPHGEKVAAVTFLGLVY